MLYLPQITWRSWANIGPLCTPYWTNIGYTTNISPMLFAHGPKIGPILGLGKCWNLTDVIQVCYTNIILDICAWVEDRVRNG